MRLRWLLIALALSLGACGNDNGGADAGNDSGVTVPDAGVDGG
jgi:hypothetical protein